MAKKLISLVFALGLLFSPLVCFAQDDFQNRENVTNWYIKEFFSKIIVSKNSTLDITEDITADCGTASGKHGIFRVLPERIKLDGGGAINTPVELISVTDFSGRNLKYSESRNFFDHTVTWKIGDPKKEVQGVNNYRIHYLVKNAIRFNKDFDELYWNLNGNFWDLETDKFHANIIFPGEVNENNSAVDYYAGTLGSKSKDSAEYKWSAASTLEFNSLKTLNNREGITASITFPKNIFTPYQAGFLESYGPYLWFFLPLIVFIICFRLWWKYGKDPRMDKSIIPEYEAPGKLAPMELGMLMANGRFSNKLITAEIINLATKKLITIKEVDNKILVFHSKDYELTKNSNPEIEKTLTPAEKVILEKVFGDGNTVKLSDLKNEFYKAVQPIKSEALKALEEKKLLVASSRRYSIGMIILGVVLIPAAFVSAGWSIFLSASIVVSGIIILIFGAIMPKRTLAGAELNWEIKGFKMFMETVDKHRAEFYEKENIFEKFLPYAIVFGITGLWIKKMKDIYGEDFYRTYAPVWFIGSMSSFDADSLNGAISGLSSSIASNTSAPSGSGGAGGAGGGGGGGGGGGW